MANDTQGSTPPKMSQTQETISSATQLVDAQGLLIALWAEESRPSLRWLRGQVAERKIPFVRMGRLVFFDPPMVREYMAAKVILPRKF